MERRIQHLQSLVNKAKEEKAKYDEATKTMIRFGCLLGQLEDSRRNLRTVHALIESLADNDDNDDKKIKSKDRTIKKLNALTNGVNSLVRRWHSTIQSFGNLFKKDDITDYNKKLKKLKIMINNPVYKLLPSGFEDFAEMILDYAFDLEYCSHHNNWFYNSNIFYGTNNYSGCIQCVLDGESNCDFYFIGPVRIDRGWHELVTIEDILQAKLLKQRFKLSFDEGSNILFGLGSWEKCIGITISTTMGDDMDSVGYNFEIITS